MRQPTLVPVVAMVAAVMAVAVMVVAVMAAVATEVAAMEALVTAAADATAVAMQPARGVPIALAIMHPATAVMPARATVAMPSVPATKPPLQLNRSSCRRRFQLLLLRPL